MSLRIDQVLIKPIVTEKTVASVNKLTFQVHLSSCEADVVKAFETFYGFTPEAVWMQNMPEKYRNFKGKQAIRKKAYKKATVKIPEGKTVDYNVFV